MDDKIKEAIEILTLALEPPTPYKRDPLEFSEAAHDEKNKLIEKAIAKLQEVTT